MVVCPYGYFCFFFSVVFNLRCLSSSQPQCCWNMVTFLTVVFIFEIFLILQSFLIISKFFITSRVILQVWWLVTRNNNIHPQSFPFRGEQTKVPPPRLPCAQKCLYFVQKCPKFRLSPQSGTTTKKRGKMP